VSTKKLGKAVSDFQISIENKVAFMPHDGETYCHGEAIRSAMAEPTGNQVVSPRMVKQQQMQSTQEGANLMLQARMRPLQDTFEGRFRQWYLGFHPSARDTRYAAASAHPRW
jgi:hypothetical protein